MTEKRFTYLDASRNKYIGSFFCNGIPLTNQEVVDLLNEMSTENRQLKKQLETEHQQLENAILLERTRMGQSALKQYKEAIQ